MNMRKVLLGSSPVSVVVLAGLSCVAGCRTYNAAPPEARGNGAMALQLVREAERTMHWAGGIADFWLPWEARMEEPSDKAPQDRDEFEAILHEAIALLKQALELDPDLHRARFDIAVIHLRLKEAELAETWAKNFLTNKPNDPQGLELLSMLYFSGRKWKELAELCEAAFPALKAACAEPTTEYVPDLSYFMRTAAIAHFYMGELEEAREWAEAAIRDDDDDVQNYLFLAIIQHAQGDTEGVAETRATLKELDPETEQALDGTIEAAEKERLKGSQP